MRRRTRKNKRKITRKNKIKSRYVGGNPTTTTLICHIFNEEYLLPFWLEHHKTMFDNIIIVDYNSNDKSVEICKTICPQCKIITSRNKMFDAGNVDEEIMDLERNNQGIKLVLNTTEFLFCEKPIKEIFSNINTPISYSIKSYSPYSKNQYNPTTNTELFSNLLNDDIVYNIHRSERFIHTFPDGKYHIGRHKTNNKTDPTEELHIIWLGYYPLNDRLLSRKQQIKDNIPQTNKNKNLGVEHLYTKEQMLTINEEKANTGKPLKDTNERLYNLLESTYKK